LETSSCEQVGSFGVPSQFPQQQPIIPLAHSRGECPYFAARECFNLLPPVYHSPVVKVKRIRRLPAEFAKTAYRGGAAYLRAVFALLPGQKSRRQVFAFIDGFV